MTELAPTQQPKAMVKAGGEIAAMVPQTLEEGFRLAQAIASSGLAPQGLKSPEQIMVAILAGAELGLPPFQSLQSFAVVNGRPTLWGDGLVALVRKNGVKVREWHEGEVAHCEVTRPDTGEVIAREFSQSDAIKAGLAGKSGPWTQYPSRMRAMRARAWAVRDGCADMLRGFQVREEVEDFQPIRDVSPPRSNIGSRLAGTNAGPGFSLPHVQRETGATDADFTDQGPEAESSPDASEGGEAANVPPPQSEDTFPGDLPLEPGPERAGVGRAVDADEPTYTFDTAEEFATRAPELCKAVKSADDLRTMWAQWAPDWNRLKKIDQPAAAKIMAARKEAQARLGIKG